MVVSEAFRDSSTLVDWQLVQLLKSTSAFIYKVRPCFCYEDNLLSSNSRIHNDADYEDSGKDICVYDCDDNCGCCEKTFSRAS